MIKPPGIQRSWEDCDLWTQALILAYDQIRSIEEAKEKIVLAGGKPD